MPKLRKYTLAALLSLTACAALAQTLPQQRINTVHDTVCDTHGSVDTIIPNKTTRIAVDTNNDSVRSPVQVQASEKRSFWGEPALWVACSTLFILMLSLLVNFWLAENGTRPTISVKVVPELSDKRTIPLVPFFKNSSKTDAQGIVKLTIEANGKRGLFEVSKGPYSGTELWQFPADAEFNGNADLTGRVKELVGQDNFNRNMPIAIEVEIYYCRFPSYVQPWLLRLMGHWFGRTIYAAPIQKHNFRYEPEVRRWVLVPEFNNKRSPSQDEIALLLGKRAKPRGATADTPA